MSLKEALEATAAASAEKFPAEKRAIMQASLNRLINEKVGAKAPDIGQSLEDFSLPDADGNTHTLETLRKKGPVVVTFYRGGWCPYCNLALQHLLGALPEIEAAGASLVAITPETPQSASDTATKNQLTFPVLSDENNAYARQIGIVFKLEPELREVYQGFGIDLGKANGNDDWELPMAATFVVDGEGAVRYRFVEADYRQRAEPAEVVAVLDSLQSAPVE